MLSKGWIGALALSSLTFLNGKVAWAETVRHSVEVKKIVLGTASSRQGKMNGWSKMGYIAAQTPELSNPKLS